MLLVALASISWGTIGVAVDVLYGIEETNAVSVGFLRMAVSVPALLLLSRRFAGPGFLRVERRDVGTMVMIAIAFAGYQVFYFAAIPLIGVAAAVMVNICSAPILISILSGIFLRERITPVVWAVLLIAILGTVLLVGGSPEADTPQALLGGAALALGAGLMYSLVALGARRVASRYHPVQPVAIAFTLGTLLLFPFALGQGLALRYSMPGWLLLVYLGLVPTVLAYALYFWGLRSTPATFAAIIALLEPLISSVLAVAFLGERLSPTAVTGGALLLGSIIFLYASQAREARRASLQTTG